MSSPMMFVSVSPGFTVFAVMPSGASVGARLRMKPDHEVLAAVVHRVGRERDQPCERARRDDRPAPLPHRAGTAARAPYTTPSTFTRWMRWYVASSSCGDVGDADRDARVQVGDVDAAELVDALANAASTSSASPQSACTAMPPTATATASAPASSKSTTHTRAPSAASRSHVALPIPLAPPVTSATFPSSCTHRTDRNRGRADDHGRPVTSPWRRASLTAPCDRARRAFGRCSRCGASPSWAESHRGCDLLVGAARCEQLQHLQLAGGELRIGARLSATSTSTASTASAAESSRRTNDRGDLLTQRDRVGPAHQLPAPGGAPESAVTERLRCYRDGHVVGADRAGREPAP